MPDTYVNTSNDPNETVAIKRDTETPISSKGGNYSEFGASNCQAEANAYDSHQSKLTDALGLKDEKKGDY